MAETNNWFRDLFIDEAKKALDAHGAISEDQVDSAVTKYLDENPVSSATATIDNNVLIVK